MVDRAVVAGLQDDCRFSQGQRQDDPRRLSGVCFLCHQLDLFSQVVVAIDGSQLLNMAKQARNAMGAEDLSVLADRGYLKGEEILKCRQAGIEVTLPKPQTSGSQPAVLFGNRDFHYVSEEDEYRCPANERLIWRMTTQEKGRRCIAIGVQLARAR